MKNIVFGLGGQILNILMSFLMRTVFVNTLPAEYLGVNGLFTNILMVFSLADLGVGTAIIYSLYKPIAVGDKQKIQALMNMYASAYRTIGLVIIGMGLAMTPFLDVFVKTDQDIPDLEIIFLLFVLNTASSYFLSYKGTLITAHQKNYIVTNVVYSTSILCYGLQMLMMVLTKNYVLTLSIQVGTNMLQNIITMIIANHMFPYIKGKNKMRLKQRERKKVFQNVRSMVFYRVGQVIINGTDSIVISAMVDIVAAGIYSNYLLLTTTIKNLLQQVFHAITASIGNLSAVESDEKKYQAYNIVYFGNFWMFGFASACFWSLFNPFITLWIGEDMLLSEDVVLLIVLNFYLVGMRNVNITFRDTMGVFKEGRYVPMIAAALNIIISIWLAPSYGILGVFIGTAVSMMASLFWMEPMILFKHGFKRSVWPYFTKYLAYLAVTILCCVVTRAACDLLPVNTIGTFIVKLFICLIVPNAIIILFFMRTAAFKALTSTVLGVIRRKAGRKAPKTAKGESNG